MGALCRSFVSVGRMGDGVVWTVLFERLALGRAGGEGCTLAWGGVFRGFWVGLTV